MYSRKNYWGIPSKSWSGGVGFPWSSWTPTKNLYHCSVSSISRILTHSYGTTGLFIPNSQRTDCTLGRFILGPSVYLRAPSMDYRSEPSPLNIHLMFFYITVDITWITGIKEYPKCYCLSRKLMELLGILKVNKLSKLYVSIKYFSVWLPSMFL